jgi:hypothetical protein
MLKYILLFLLMPCFAHAQYYTSSQILNKVLVSSTAIKGTLNETQVLNLVYNPNASALNVRLDTNTATSPYVLKTGDTMTGQLTINNATMTITGNAFSVGTSTFVVVNGNVGIGNTSPNAKLQVVSGIVNVSTATTSSVHLCLAGAFDTLPTSGYNKGCMAYQNSDNTLYVSTETVVSANSWKPVW